MEMKKIEFEAPKEITEVGECLAEIVKAAATAMADGWQSGQDIPVILAASFGGLMKAIEGCNKIPEEVAAAPSAAILGALTPVAFSIESLVKTLKK